MPSKETKKNTGDKNQKETGKRLALLFFNAFHNHSSSIHTCIYPVCCYKAQVANSS